MRYQNYNKKLPLKQICKFPDVTDAVCADFFAIFVLFFENQSFVLCFSFNFQQLLPKKTLKKTPQNLPPSNNCSKLAPVHAHKTQDLAEINIISNMKRVETNFFSFKIFAVLLTNFKCEYFGSC